jgi:hypothetical protein
MYPFYILHAFFYLRNEIHDKDGLYIYIYIYIYIRSRPGHVPGYPVMLDNIFCNIVIQFILFFIKTNLFGFYLIFNAYFSMDKSHS